MSKLTILSERELAQYEYPPIFQSSDYVHFLRLPHALQVEFSGLRSLTNQVCFHLMYAYFKASGRFFVPNKFRERDVEWVCKHLGVFAFAVDCSTYNRETYSRHKSLLLSHFGYAAFDAKQHESILQNAARQMIQSQFRPKLVFDFMLDVLREQRIELPSYRQLQITLSAATKVYDEVLLNRLKIHLTEAQRTTLDSLLSFCPADLPEQFTPKRDTYLLTWLKHFDVKDAQRSILSNVQRLKQIQAIYQQLSDLINAMQLNPSAIRHYGELVLHYSVYKIKRRKASSRYLHLLAFVAYQRWQLEDMIMDSFLHLVRKWFNKANRQYKEQVFEQHQEQRPMVRKMFNGYLDIAQRQEKALSVLWAEDSQIDAAKRIELLHQILPKDAIDAQQTALVEQTQQQYNTQEQDNYLDILVSLSKGLQQKVNPIIKQLHFNADSSDSDLMATIEAFKNKGGVITASVPMDFLTEEQQKSVFDENGKFRISLFKMLFFQALQHGVKAGTLNLKYSARYKAYDDYLIPASTWKTKKSQLLKSAQLEHALDERVLLDSLKPKLQQAFVRTNEGILQGQNKFMSFHKNGKFSIKTPKIDEPANPKTQHLYDLFPETNSVPLSEVLASVQEFTSYLEAFVPLQSKYHKKRPDNAVFYAAIMAYSCNLGIPTMTKVAKPIPQDTLEHSVNWYFDLGSVHKANDAIIDFMASLDLSGIYHKASDLHTSSDGQQVEVKGNTIYANYSYKNLRAAKGVSAYSFIDERDLNFFSTIISPIERESTHVIDGLMHNDVVKSTRHSTDTHGYTDAVFALTNLLGFEFAPRIAKIYKRRIYAFEKDPRFVEKDYKVLPKAYINTKIISENWDNILRLVTSIKLKECTASQIFKRLNSYSRQHPVYQALKEYGKIIKSIFILQYLDQVKLRQAIHKQLNKIEHSNRFSNAVWFANKGQLIFPTRQEQLIAEGCKRLIKNAIVCWNYLFLTQTVLNAASEQRKREILQFVKDGSVMAWQHVYFHGLYDFSEDKLNNSFQFNPKQDIQLNWKDILKMD